MVEKMYWILILFVLALGCALFSNKIDEAFKARPDLKKVIMVFSVGVLLTCTVVCVFAILS